MFKDGRYINAGTNEIYRYGKKAVAMVEAALTPNEAGFYTIPADGGKYWTFGTTVGAYGEFAKFGDIIIPVNRAGNLWAKADHYKAAAFCSVMRAMIVYMHRMNAERATEEEEGEDE